MNQTKWLDIELRSSADLVIREFSEGRFTLECGAGAEELTEAEMKALVLACVEIGKARGWFVPEEAA